MPNQPSKYASPQSRQPYYYDERLRQDLSRSGGSSAPQAPEVPRSAYPPGTATQPTTPFHQSYQPPRRSQTYEYSPQPSSQHLGRQNLAGQGAQPRGSNYFYANQGRAPTRSNTVSSSGGRQLLQWVPDSVPSYRLTKRVVEDWLKRRFPKEVYESDEFRVELIDDMFTFRVPERLGTEEKEIAIAELKWKDSDDEDG